MHIALAATTGIVRPRRSGVVHEHACGKEPAVTNDGQNILSGTGHGGVYPIFDFAKYVDRLGYLCLCVCVCVGVCVCVCFSVTSEEKN